MRFTKNNDAVLVLQDGTVFHGKAAGLNGTTSGEIAFNTGMTGYQEIFTDPSYLNQVVVMTASHIGNYGVHPKEAESDSVKISGLVCKRFSDIFSREGASESLHDFFIQNSIVAISDVDTRALVRHIRSKGAMNCIISSDNLDIEDLKLKLANVPSMDGLELSSRVSTKKAYYLGNPEAKYKVSVLDLGVKRSILSCLVERDCYLKVFPMHSTIQEMLDWQPNGFMLSNGPGDPSVMADTITLVNQIILSKCPVFGICLGHQLIALASGLKTVKMHNGHRGINHPVKNLISGKGEITSQNHGFVVDIDTARLDKNIEITHMHLNDNTLAGIRRKDFPVFSVQYHPEASAGPHDSRYLFDDFIYNMKQNLNN